MKNVKIYGERNTGTIYLEWLLKSNLEIKIDKSPVLGWKHRLVPSLADLEDEIREETLFICLVKNPYSWLLSMHKRPYHHEVLKKFSFSDFLRYSYGDYENPMVMWNMKNNSYVRLENDVSNHMIIRYEDLLSNMKSILLEIANKFDLPVPSMFKNINSLITNSHGIKPQKFHRAFYIEEKWRKSIMPHHAKLINASVDSQLMEKLNYLYL